MQRNKMKMLAEKILTKINQNGAQGPTFIDKIEDYEAYQTQFKCVTANRRCCKISINGTSSGISFTNDS